jgi:predicted TPR repeat methyltransferase
MSTDPAKGGPAATLTVAEIMTYAVSLAASDKVDSADLLFQQVSAQLPRYPDPWNFRGIIATQRKQFEQAEAFFRQAIELAPEYAEAHSNLGNLLLKLKRYDEAVRSFQTALELRPELVSAHHNLGNAYAAQERHLEAIAAYHRALALDPERAQTQVILAQEYSALGLDREALDSYQSALRLSPGETGIYGYLGGALAASGIMEGAARVYGRWLELEPDSELARHLHAACTGQGTPERASDRYVTETFDMFAECFDKVLETLEYRAPALVGQAVAEVTGTPAGTLEVLDAGCGTGLCGQWLQPHARRLVGVDLSEKMLEKARGRGLYDELVRAELVGFLAAHPAAFHLVVSADTLCYFGNLAAAMAAAGTTLRPGGHLVFTVERAEDHEAPAGFRLNHHGRYSHTEGYLRAVLAAAGLRARSLASATLRLELGKPVAGLVVIADR